MNTVLVWIIVAVANTNGVTSHTAQAFYPSFEQCEKIRRVEQGLVAQMADQVWGATKNPGYYLQSKCEQVQVLVAK